MSIFGSKIRSIRGFSLVEVLVALTLFGFLISGIMTFVTAGLDVTKKAESQLTAHHDESAQIRQLEAMLVFPIKRIDAGLTSISTTSGALLEIGNKIMFVGTQSMSGACTGSPDQQYLVTVEAGNISKNENKNVGAYRISDDGLSILSGSTRVVGSGVRGGTNGPLLETEFGGISSLSGSGNVIAIADPYNEQVLFWNTTLSSLSSITTRATGIQFPSSVKYSGNSLLIGGKNGLFKLKDSEKNGTELEKNSMSGPQAGVLSLGRLKITLDGVVNPITPTGTGDIQLEQWQAGSWQSLTTPDDTLSIGSGSYQYTFSGSARSLIAGNPIRINLKSISPVPTVVGEYTATLEFFDTSDTSVWSKKIPYFTKGDGQLTSLAGNTIELVSSAAFVRNIINESSFESGGVSVDEYLASTGNITISRLPIQNYTMRESAADLVISYDAYTENDCKTGVEKTKEKTLVFRKKN